jgi:hypothetical protein
MTAYNLSHGILLEFVSEPAYGNMGKKAEEPLYEDFN